MKLAERMSRIGVETAFDILVQARKLEAQGKRIIHLEIGEPDFDTPKHIVEAARKALADGWTHYGPTQGYPDLREAIAAYINRTRHINVGPENVSVVPGGKPIIFFPILALIEEGDEVIYPNPGFPIYESMINFIGAKAVPMPVVGKDGFEFDLNKLESLINDKTKMLILNSPQNPTGGVLSYDQIKAIADMVRDRDLIVLADEIYCQISYDAEPVSITQFPGMLEKTIILDGFSKTYAMTGWRLGYGVAPTWITDAITRLMVNSNSCPASFTQRAGLAALVESQEPSEKMVAEFHRRRDAFCAGLNKVPGFKCPIPGGAFYAFPSVKGTGIPSKELTHALMYEAGVAACDGTAFGAFGDGYIRFSYANSYENLMEAVAKVDACVRSHMTAVV